MDRNTTGAGCPALLLAYSVSPNWISWMDFVPSLPIGIQEPMTRLVSILPCFGKKIKCRSQPLPYAFPAVGRRRSIGGPRDRSLALSLNRCLENVLILADRSACCTGSHRSDFPSPANERNHQPTCPRFDGCGEPLYNGSERSQTGRKPDAPFGAGCHCLGCRFDRSPSLVGSARDRTSISGSIVPRPYGVDPPLA
jgi:hypothetical protein